MRFRSRATAVAMTAVSLAATSTVLISAPAHAGEARYTPPTADQLRQLRGCESGGNYQINTGNGYYGAYQFDQGTWSGLGYGGRPDQAPPAVQDDAASRLEQARGWQPWPGCRAKLGLVATRTDGSGQVGAPMAYTPPGSTATYRASRTRQASEAALKAAADKAAADKAAQKAADAKEAAAEEAAAEKAAADKIAAEKAADKAAADKAAAEKAKHAAVLSIRTRIGAIMRSEAAVNRENGDGPPTLLIGWFDAVSALTEPTGTASTGSATPLLPDGLNRN